MGYREKRINNSGIGFVISFCSGQAVVFIISPIPPFDSFFPVVCKPVFAEPLAALMFMVGAFCFSVL